jgi:hypothetical protein
MPAFRAFDTNAHDQNSFSRIITYMSIVADC